MRKADNLPPSCAVVTKSGNLNFLKSSGLFQACNGTAIYIYIYIYMCVYVNCVKVYFRKEGAYACNGFRCLITYEGESNENLKYVLSRDLLNTKGTQ